MSAIDPFAGMRLRCTGCPPRDRVSSDGSEAFEELPALTKATRKPDDPPSVCRCAKCGKKHSTDSLEVA